MFDGKAFGAEVVSVVKSYLDEKLDPALYRISEIEKRLSEMPVPRDGVDGKDADVGEVSRLVRDDIAEDLADIRKSIESIPSPQEFPDVDGMIAAAVSGFPREERVKEIVADSALGEDSIKAMVVEAIAGIPPARDGKDADPEQIAAIVTEKVDAAVAALPKAQDGKSVTVEDVRPLIVDAVSEAVSALPAPMDGRDGADGKDGSSVSVDDIRPVIEEMVAAIPHPRDGVDGKDGRDGIDGKDGSSVSIDDVQPMVEEMVAAIPAPRDGVDGKDGRDGIDGKDGSSVSVDDVRPVVEQMVAAIPRAKDGVDGRDGRDGVGMAGAIIDRSGNLTLTLTNGETRDLGPVVGKDGEPGLGFDDLTVEMEDERDIILRMQRGERQKEFRISLPVMIYRGVYNAGHEYKTGDTVTWGGSLWVAERDTGDKPEPENGWKLAVKKGRDGKDGVARQDGPKEPIKFK